MSEDSGGGRGAGGESGGDVSDGGRIPMDNWNQCIPDWQHPVESSVTAWSDGWSGPEVRALLRGQLATLSGGRELDVCWMLKSHLEQVVEVEEQCYGMSAGPDDVVARLKAKDCVGLVALDQTGLKSGRRLMGEGKVLGYCIYRMCDGRSGVVEGWGRGVEGGGGGERKKGNGCDWKKDGGGWIPIPQQGQGGRGDNWGEDSDDVDDVDDVVGGAVQSGCGGLTRPVRSTRISDLGVRDDERRKGVGTLLVSRVLRGMLSRPRDVSAVVEVPERFVDGQVFFRSLGFRADEMLRCAVRGGRGRGAEDDGGFGQVVMRWHKPFDPSELFEVLTGGDLPR